MKKILYSLMVLAMTALTFTSCEDVPEPYPLPTESGAQKEQEPAAEPAGKGTAEDPYNVSAAQDLIASLGADVQSADVYVKGKISQIDELSTSYGNATYYISDSGTASNQLEVYRGYGLGGEKFTSTDDIKVGDDVIVKGKLVNFRGNTPEFTQGSMIYSLNGKVSGGGGGTPSGNTGTPSGDGTVDNPYNSVAANSYVSGLPADQESDKDIYIKGKIAKIANNGEFNANYGNASFYISDDGKDENTFYVFRTLYLGNKKWTTGDTQIKVGDEVVICGRVINYMGNTPETSGNKSYIYKLNSGGGGDTPAGTDPKPTQGTGDGSLSNPFNSVAATSVASQLGSGQNTTNSYYIKGKIAKMANNGEFGAQYGNASFYISDDGKDENTFYIFRTLYLGNRKWVEGDTQVKVGDEVIVCAKLTNYQGNTPETVQGETYLYSLNGKTDDSGSGGQETGQGTYDNPYDVASAIAKGSAEGVYLKGFIVGYVEGQVYAEGLHFNADGENVSVTNILLAPSASETDGSKCMPIQLPKGDVRTALNLKDNPGNLGKEVLLYGDIATYFSVPGFKNTSYAEIGGKTIGTKASAKRRSMRR